jgi:anti-sigma28 factor (negative regulator of flagellin synthesis)
VLRNYYQISKSASDDVRWERVEHIKLKLTSGAYPVTAEEVAAKLIEYMLKPWS